MSDFSKIKIAPGSYVLRERRHTGLSAPFLKYNHLDRDKRDLPFYISALYFCYFFPSPTPAPTPIVIVFRTPC